MSLSLNYLHYGLAVEGLYLITEHFTDGSRPYKKDVINFLRSRGRFNGDGVIKLIDLIRAFDGLKTRKISIADFNHAAEDTRRWKRNFQLLKCRGFSFRFCPRLFFSRHLKSHIDLRFGLMSDPLFYYPPKVRGGLDKAPEHRHIHLKRGIGWMLGTEQRIGGEKSWLIVNIQSDILSAGSTAVREIFRGWQRVLFQCVLTHALRNHVAKIGIATADAVTKASFYHSSSPATPPSWRRMYDGTANFFDLRRDELRRPIDLQTIRYWRSVPSTDFFLADMKMLPKNFLEEISNG